MKRIIIFTLLCFMQYFVFAQTPTNDSHWQLKWQDNFDTFDTNKWIKGHNAVHGNPEEPQLYLESQVFTSNGNLVLTLNNTKVTCPAPGVYSGVCNQCTNGKQYNYRSGLVETKEDYNTQFGYIEARIKFPYREGKKWGVWPAFWVWHGWNAPYSNAAEIDICEIFARNNPPDRFEHGIVRFYGPNPPREAWGITHVFSNFSYADWHTYAIEWNPSRIIWYLDGKAITSLSNHKIVDPVRIILNLAVLKENAYLPQTSPYFEEKMYVDYVKVYQLKCDKNTVVNEISNFNTYNYAVKKSISLSNATTIPANSNISLRATDFIELKAGFEVQTGRELYLDVNPMPGECAVSAPIDIKRK